MKIQLINGQFTVSETNDLISQLVQVKIKFLENKINSLQHEEDIKSKETKIVALQNTLSNLRNHINLEKLDVVIKCDIEINFSDGK